MIVLVSVISLLIGIVFGLDDDEPEFIPANFPVHQYEYFPEMGDENGYWREGRGY